MRRSSRSGAGGTPLPLSFRLIGYCGGFSGGGSFLNQLMKGKVGV